MRTTTKGKFAVAAMIEVASGSREEPVSVAEISLRRSISLSYLEQLLSKLRRGGLVRSIRGSGGGYVLAREAATISVADIVAAVDREMEAGLLDTRSAAPPGGVRCDTSDLWRDVHSKMLELLGSISLAVLLDDPTMASRPARGATVRRGISSAAVVKPVRTSAPNSVFALGQSDAMRSKVT